MEFSRIHPDTIEDVKSKIDIVDIVGEHVLLKKRGKDYQGLCPFHQEKTPSFTVSPTKQMYYCFGCEAGGNGIKFLMEIGKQSFVDVVLDLARRYQIPVKTIEGEKREQLQQKLSEREQLYEILAIAANFYAHALQQIEGKIALDYLIDQRKLSPETIAEFNLGYAPRGWEALYQYLVFQKNFPVNLVENAGLIIKRDQGTGYYDRFRHRLMIPIRDIQGRIIAFGGRSLDDTNPKYLNSPETELFDKGKVLFGLDRAKKAMVKTDQAIVVEGYFDAIALQSVGINQVVATLGVALNIQQIKLLLKFTESKEIVLNFDGDRAGIKATERVIGAIGDLAYSGEVKLKVVNLTNGKDADEFLRTSGKDNYIELINQAPFWLDWQFNKVLNNYNLNLPYQYQKANQEMMTILEKISDNYLQNYYIQIVANLLSNKNSKLENSLLENIQRNLRQKKQDELSNYYHQTSVNPPNNIARSATETLLTMAEGLLLKIYLNEPNYRLQIIDRLDSSDLIFTVPHYRWLWQQIMHYTESGKIDYYDEQLIIKLQDLSIEYDAEMRLVNHLFILKEGDRSQLQRIPLVIQAAIACLEKITFEKQKKELLEKWQETKDQAYYDGFYQTNQRLLEIEKTRLFSIDELI